MFDYEQIYNLYIIKNLVLLNLMWIYGLQFRSFSKIWLQPFSGFIAPTFLRIIAPTFLQIIAPTFLRITAPIFL